MKTLVFGVLFFANLLVSSISYGESNSIDQKGIQILGGEYWPWGKEVNFPWSSIQGIWFARDSSGYSSYFSFKVLNQNQERILRVEQYEGSNCVLIGRGIGYEKDRVVKARFTGYNGDFDLRIHVFKESDVIKAGRSFMGMKMITVMAMNPANNPGVSSTLKISKINANPNLVCE